MYISDQWSKIDPQYCMKINPKFKLLTSYWLPLKYESIFRFLGTSLTDLSDLTSITLNLIQFQHATESFAFPVQHPSLKSLTTKSRVKSVLRLLCAYVKPNLITKFFRPILRVKKHVQFDDSSTIYVKVSKFHKQIFPSL